MPPIPILVKRLLISLLIGLLLGIAIGEIPFIFLRETARPPREVRLTIPVGTAEQVARGEPSPAIPENMLFVVGDTLVVENQDIVDHKLGPLWIPARSSARLSLDQKESLAFECTFQPDKYFGLDVRDSLTFSTRLYGILYAGLPIAILVAIYSFVIPVKKRENAVT